MMSGQDRVPQQVGGPSLENIEHVRNHSALFRAECLRLMSETDKQCKRMHNDCNKQLDQRKKDVQFLKQELELKLEEIMLETDELTALQSRVVRALEANREPLRVTNLCLEERMKRPPCDRLHDKVHIELLNERKAFEEVASILQRVVEQIVEQIRLNRSAKYLLEQDLKEKSEAQCIDDSCSIMTTHINTLQHSENTKAVLQSLTVTPKEWENFSDTNIAKAEEQKANSVSLRALVQSVLEQTFTDVQKQIQLTNAAFQLIVKEIKSAKSQMENKLAKILTEFGSQQQIREALQVAITDTERVLNAVQARLALRRQRPAKEHCHDPVQSHLLSEVHQFTANIKKLREAVAQSEAEERALVRCQLELQQNIKIKAKCLYIDEVICTQHRESIVIHKF